ncbi:MAG: Gldg family protein [Thermodesulfobacteriota bacterium]
MKTTQSKIQPYVKFALYCLAVVLVNIVGVTLFFRLDLTADNKYSLSTASRETLARISEPLTIKIFFTRDLPAPHNITEQYLHDLMEEYAAGAGKNFNYQFYNVTSRDGQEDSLVSADQKLAEDYGVFPVQVQNIEADEVKVKKAYMGLVIIYGDMVEKVTPIRSTDGLEYQITTAIRKLADKVSAFAGLPGKINISLVLSSSLYPVAPYMGLKDLAGLPDSVGKVVAGMNDRLAGKLDYEVVDPVKATGREEEIKNLDLIRLEWPEIAEPDMAPIAAGQGVIGLVMRYQGRTATLPLLNVMNLPFFGTRYSLPDEKDMSAQIDQSLESLVGINDDLGYLAGHGAPNANTPNMFGQQPVADDSLINLRQLTGRSYSWLNIDPAGDDLGRESVECLIIASPTEPFTDYELFQIDQYLMRGRNLAIFLNQFQEVYPEGQPAAYAQPRSVPVSTGLENLLAHYGVKIRPTTILDEECFKRPADPRTGDGEESLYIAPLIKNETINNQPAFMKNIKGLVAVSVSPLELQTETLKANGITATTLFSSSKRSWEHQGPVSLNAMFMPPPSPDAERKSFPLACLLEGEFPSYFAGKPVPVKEDPAITEENLDAETNKAGGEKARPVAASGQVIAKGKRARIFVMGSSQMLYDHMLDVEGRTPNAVFIMNLLDTLNHRDKIAQLRSKRQAYNPINETAAPVRSLIKWGNIAGLPVLVIVLGCLVWARRLSRKRQIRMLFSK